jgi:F-type H+-transporting ATPase subunit a
MLAQEHVQEAVEHAAGHGPEKFDAGKTIIEHVSNSALDHPLIHLPTIGGIDLSVTKHVLMLWLVAAFVFLVVTVTVRRYLAQDRLVPRGLMNGLEAMVEFVRDSIALPNVGKKWVNSYTPLFLTFFFFILAANAIGLIPVFEVLALVDRFVLHTGEHSFLNQVIHGGTTATGNFNVTAALAVITFVTIIIAGSRAHGFVKHWMNLVPHGLNPALYILLIPIEIMGMLVKPFALTMRLAANMTGGHIAILSILSFAFLFAELGGSLLGTSIGVVAVPISAALSGLEIIVVLVQAYVFTLLTAVFVGMAIHVHH